MQVKAGRHFRTYGTKSPQHVPQEQYTCCRLCALPQPVSPPSNKMTGGRAKAGTKSQFTLGPWTIFVNALSNCYNAPNIWAISSFGRAFPWHGKGDRFESGMVHRIRSTATIFCESP